MVGKINSGTSFFGAVEYNQEKVDKGKARIILQNQMIENYSGDSNLDRYFTLRTFEPYLEANSKTEKPVVHISLNPDPKDLLTDEQYSRLAHDYMEKMGFGGQPYIVYRHEDIDRHHLHIVTVRVDEKGKKITDSFEKLRSMDACRELETKYGLHPAIKKNPESGDIFIGKPNYEHGDIKRQISNTLKSMVQLYKFQTFGEYNALLSCLNIDVKQVQGAKFGREYNGIVYAAKNDRGEVASNPFKSSLFGKTYGFNGLAKIMKNSAEMLKGKDLTGYSKSVVAGAMRTAGTRADFEKALKAKNMDAVFRTSDRGRIYGVTFIDHVNRVVLNGSRLGKEFSANVFNDLYNNRNVQNKSAAPSVTHQQNTGALPDKPSKDTAINADTSLFEEAFGIFDMKAQGEDYEELAFAGKRKRKKKKKLE
jgi:hypothetical protein